MRAKRCPTNDRPCGRDPRHRERSITSSVAWSARAAWEHVDRLMRQEIDANGKAYFSHFTGPRYALRLMRIASHPTRGDSKGSSFSPGSIRVGAGGGWRRDAPLPPWPWACCGPGSGGAGWPRGRFAFRPGPFWARTGHTDRPLPPTNSQTTQPKTHARSAPYHPSALSFSPPPQSLPACLSFDQ